MKMLILLHILYDPMGVLIPFLIIGKLQVQECWRLGLAWKDIVPQEIKEAWFKWQDQIDQLKGIEIKRTLIPRANPDIFCVLLTCSDVYKKLFPIFQSFE
jgi:hypothetical protein